jgi:hypothetical protein
MASDNLCRPNLITFTERKGSILILVVLSQFAWPIIPISSLPLQEYV